MKIYDIVWGIDPGQSGGWAYSIGSGVTVNVGTMPIVGGNVHVFSLAEQLNDQLSKGAKVMVVLEKVHAMPAQGVSSTFKFGTNFGKLEGLCQALNLSFDYVTPQAWKKQVLVGTKKDKFAAIDYARRIYGIDCIPQGRKVAHDGIADAIGIMTWGVNKYGKTKEGSRPQDAS